jgi:hypothetical protein
LIALAEAFRFTVLGVNECGEYESCERLLGAAVQPNQAQLLTRPAL